MCIFYRKAELGLETVANQGRAASDPLNIKTLYYGKGRPFSVYLLFMLFCYVPGVTFRQSMFEDGLHTTVCVLVYSTLHYTVFIIANLSNWGRSTVLAENYMCVGLFTLNC